MKTFGATPIGAITRGDAEAYLAGMGGYARATRRLAWQVLMGVLDYAVEDGALPANPARSVARHAVPAVAAREHHPLAAAQVAAVAAAARERSAVDELLVLFLCYTGLRKTEAQGLELRDLTLITGPHGTTGGSVRVVRTKDRRYTGGNAAWVTGTPKSKRSNRTVPLPPWLATKLAAYLADTHEHADTPEAPLWPRRVRGGPLLPTRVGSHNRKGVRFAVTFDYGEPMDLAGWAKRVLRPALKAAGVEGCRLHDTRHTFASLQLSAGVHFMQVSKWLGHANYTLTLNTYGEWIPGEDGGVPNNLPEPKPAKAKTTNVVQLRAATGGY